MIVILTIFNLIITIVVDSEKPNWGEINKVLCCIVFCCIVLYCIVLYHAVFFPNLTYKMNFNNTSSSILSFSSSSAKPLRSLSSFLKTSDSFSEISWKKLVEH